MLANPSAHDWLGQFSLRLMELSPGIGMLEAVQLAVANHAYARELEPERAAQMFLAHWPNGSQWLKLPVPVPDRRS